MSDRVVKYLKEKGFVYPGSAIYGGLANSWDYGPLGAMLKDNIKAAWKNEFITQQANVVQFDSSIILNNKVWETSGHIDKFNDPLIDCKSCKSRFRADHLLEEKGISFKGDDLTDITEKIKSNIECPSCSANDWTDTKQFDLMFRVNSSKTDSAEFNFLRPETAQGIFINYKNLLNTYNFTLPYGVAQIGKAFRNEVTPGNFIFRTKEFEQMELELFCSPSAAEGIFEEYLLKINSFLKRIHLNDEALKSFDVAKDSLAHYSTRTVDYEYNFSFGWGELLGLANRTDFDLTNHSVASGEKVLYNDLKEGTKYVPHVIEASFGVERLLLAIIESSLKMFKTETEDREVLSLPFELSPYKVCVAPLTNKLVDEAEELFSNLTKQDIGAISFETSGSIGKRYRRQDQIGTYFVITYDFDTLEDDSVTIRHRDTMKQDRIKISDIKTYINEQK